MSRLLATSLACCTLVLLAPPAGATEATSAEVRALAERAIGDPSLVEELRAIDVVDGRPVDHDAALGTVTGAQLERRLHSLADDASLDSPTDPQPGGSGFVDPEGARREANEVLDQGKFKERDIPRPFKGLLDGIGERLRKVGNWLGELADDVTGGNPRWLFWGLLVGAALLGVAFGRRLIHRQARKVREVELDRASTETVDPDELEADADAAERDGRLEEAIRLRFRAGLMRLSRARAIPARPSLTSGDVARYLQSRRFEEVAATFDEVVYGRRTARTEDVERSRSGWRSVLEEKSRS